MVKFKNNDKVELKATIKDYLSNYFKNIAINQFEYNIKDYSDTLTSEIMEDILYTHGKSLFFKDSTYGFMNLEFNNHGGLNVYGKPVKFMAVGIGYTKPYNIDNSVIIRNNATMTPTKDLIDYYCEKLADIELTKDLQRNAHKIPYFVYCDEQCRLSAENIMKQIKDNMDYLVFPKNKSGENPVHFDVFNPQVEYINDKLEDEYNSYVAKILNVLGIDNYVEDKAERVQSAEVNAQKEFVIKSYDAQYEFRQKACEQINKMFGINLTVERKKVEYEEEEEEENVEREE